MSYNIDKFNESSFVTKADLQKNYDISIKDIEKIIDILERYELDSVLLRELKNAKSSEYKTLRKWKVDSFMKRYANLKEKLDEIELIEDYLLEIVDEGNKVKILHNRSEIQITTQSADAIKAINDVTSCLVHLGNRLKITLTDISRVEMVRGYTGVAKYRLTIVYEIVGKEKTKTKIEKTNLMKYLLSTGQLSDYQEDYEEEDE
jgi:hypothetical protein